MPLQQRQPGRPDGGAEVRRVAAPLLPARTRTNQSITVLARRTKNGSIRPIQLAHGMLDQQDFLWKIPAHIALEILIYTMHRRAELNGLLISLDSLTPGRQQKWLDREPPPKTREEATTQKQVKRLIRLSRDKENE